MAAFTEYDGFDRMPIGDSWRGGDAGSVLTDLNPWDGSAAGTIQATSLSIPVVAGAIGVGLGLMSKSDYAALVAAGLLSVLIFALVALKLLPLPPTETSKRGMQRSEDAGNGRRRDSSDRAGSGRRIPSGHQDRDGDRHDRRRGGRPDQ
jgi:hypothetical protein